MNEFDDIFPSNFNEELDKKLDKELKHSMDASDPSSQVQPGTTLEPVPSSGFPEKFTLWQKIRNWFKNHLF